jgi:molecular chaperone GrpE
MDDLSNLLAAFDATGKIRLACDEHQRNMAAVLLDLIAVLDSLDRLMICSAPNGVNSLDLLRRQMKELLSRQGVEEIDCLGAVFDPHWHEAGDRRTVSKTPAGTILEVIQRGYCWKGNLLRAPRVVVADDVSHNQTFDRETKV